VESVLENVGASEKTVDEEFDINYGKFTRMMLDLNECGAANYSALALQKSYFADGVALATSIARIHKLYELPSEYWPGTESNLISFQGAIKYKEVMTELHNVNRSSSAITCLDKAIDPLRDAIAEINPRIEAMVKDRNIQLIDYDSYKRRLKSLREKRDALEVSFKYDFADISLF
jgi:hypothetical protein